MSVVSATLIPGKKRANKKSKQLDNRGLISDTEIVLNAVDHPIAVGGGKSIHT